MLTDHFRLKTQKMFVLDPKPTHHEDSHGAPHVLLSALRPDAVADSITSTRVGSSTTLLSFCGMRPENQQAMHGLWPPTALPDYFGLLGHRWARGQRAVVRKSSAEARNS